MGVFSKLFGGVPSSRKFAGKRVLVVEPSITIQKVIELTLSDFSVVTASNAKEAKAALGKAPFDLVISAAILPDMTGYELCVHVKSSGRTPVIVLTGTFEPFDENRARQAKADAVITKPFDSGTFVAEVERVLSVI